MHVGRALTSLVLPGLGEALAGWPGAAALAICAAISAWAAGWVAVAIALHVISALIAGSLVKAA